MGAVGSGLLQNAAWPLLVTLSLALEQEVMFSSSAAGALPYDHSLVRETKGLLRRLPAINTAEFQQDFLAVRVQLLSSA